MMFGCSVRSLFPGALFALVTFAACQQEPSLPADSGTPAGDAGTTLPGDCVPGTYPRLVMCPGEVSVARSRRNTSPYQGMYKRVKAEAAKSLVTPTATYNKDTEAKNARVAKHAALVAILEQDAAMAQKAVDGVTRLQSNWELGLGLGKTDLFIRIVGPLQDGLEAFDLVMGSKLATAAQQAAMEKALGDVAAKLYEMWVVGQGSMLVKFCQNNYNTKMSTTMGLAALMLDGHKRRKDWLRFAATESNRFYGDGVADKNLYLSAEGVCKEPPAYFNFGGRAALPFAILYEYMIGRGAAYDNDCSVSTIDCKETKLKLDGILHSPRFRKAFHWMAKIQMPNGRRPSIDEGCTHDPPPAGALWHYVNRDTVPLWDHVFASRGDAINNPQWAGTYMARVDFSAAPKTLDLGQTQNFQKSGQVIFRNSWKEDAIYAVVLGEAGVMRSLVHNHADATSFQLVAFGELLAMDTGYFEPPGEDSMKSRAKTVGPEAHNLILVDGKGAPSPSLVRAGDVDAVMRGTLDTDGLDFTEVQATYQGVTITRGVLFASERYLVVADRVEGTKAHEYSWRLHGFGGGSSIRKNYEVGTFSLGTDSAVWSRTRASMMLVLDSTHGRPKLKTGTFPHEFRSSWEGYHSYVDGVISSTAAKPKVSYLAVVFPQKAGASFPAIQACKAGADTACLTVTKQGFSDIMVAGAAGVAREISVAGFGKLQTDAAFCWLSVGSDGNAARALIQGGKTLVYAGKKLLDNTRGEVAVTFQRKP